MTPNHLCTNLIIVLCIYSQIALAQDEDQKKSGTISIANGKEQPEGPENTIFTVVEDMPSFPGGDSAMLNFLASKIRYPDSAKINMISGAVYISFIINELGAVTEATVLRGIGGGCDEEALRVVNSMPSWTPGVQRGRRVKVQFTLPIRFMLK